MYRAKAPYLFFGNEAFRIVVLLNRSNEPFHFSLLQFLLYCFIPSDEVKNANEAHFNSSSERYRSLCYITYKVSDCHENYILNYDFFSEAEKWKYFQKRYTLQQ